MRIKTDARCGPHGAFTLVETMVSLAVSAFILLAILLASVAFQKVFVATDEYYSASGDQMRVLDSIALDMRRAISGSVSNGGQTLTLKLPDYIDYSQSPPAPRTPTVSPTTGAVIYGAAAAQPTVVYTVVGNSPAQAITRTYTPSSGSATVTTLTSTAAQLGFSNFDPNSASSTASFTFGGAGEPTSVTSQVTFMPRFTRLNLATSRTGTTATMTVQLRNHQ